MTEVKFLSFNRATGSLVVSNGVHEFAIDVPIEDGQFISGEALQRYVNGIVSVSTPKDVSTVKGASAIEAVCLRTVESRELTYAELRANAYPPVTMYLDAVVRGDEAEIKAYKDRCLAVKAMFPKPNQEQVSEQVLKNRREGLS